MLSWIESRVEAEIWRGQEKDDVQAEGVPEKETDEARLESDGQALRLTAPVDGLNERYLEGLLMRDKLPASGCIC